MGTVSIIRNALFALAACSLSAAAQTAAAGRVGHNEPAAYAEASPAAWTGVYRLELVSRDRGLVFVRLLLEREGDNVAGTIISDDFQSTIYNIRFAGDEMRATMPTDQGTGEVVLKNTPAGVTGTLTVRGKTWSISGRRTT